MLVGKRKQNQCKTSHECLSLVSFFKLDQIFDLPCKEEKLKCWLSNFKCLFFSKTRKLLPENSQLPENELRIFTSLQLSKIASTYQY